MLWRWFPPPAEHRSCRDKQGLHCSTALQQPWFYLTFNPYLSSSASSPCWGLPPAAACGVSAISRTFWKDHPDSSKHFSLSIAWQMKTFYTAVLFPSSHPHFNCYLPSSLHFGEIIHKDHLKVQTLHLAGNFKVSSKLVYVYYRPEHESTTLLVH